MNKLVIGGIVGVLVVGAIAVFILSLSDKPKGGNAQLNDPGNTISRPAVQAVPNTFSIMTAEEKAVADEQARLKAEAAAQASSTATSSEEELEGDAELEVETTN